MMAHETATGPVEVVAVAAHPDDLEITCGGTLALLVKQGYRVAMLDLTDGEPTPRGTPEIRAQEAEAARQALGVHLRVCVGLPNRVLMDCPENRFALATWLRRLRPQIVLVMAGRTPAASPDHYQAQLLVEAARFYSQLTKWDDRFGGTAPYRVPHLVYAPVPADAEIRHWHTTFVVDISETFEQKLQAVRCYYSQFDDHRFERLRHFLTCYNGHLGTRCGFRFGELFALPHPLGTANLVHTVLGGHSSYLPAALTPASISPHG
ncbi:MAG: PIG-L family deacetylase [Gemmatales bacterium]|nr:PIG-L family deacetylase [Gemmatales bacterium]MDW8174637.1 PIG-L family deacetylase [Gemmatales bacterium]